MSFLRVAAVLATVQLTACIEPDEQPPGSVSAEIVGGDIVAWDDYPWVVKVYDDKTWQSDVLTCGGSLVAPDWVVSAAHCADFSDYVRVLGTRIKIVARVVHPDAAFPRNDIALFRLAEPVDVTPLALNIDVGFPAAIDLAAATDSAANSRALGWGRTSEGGDGSSDLRAVDLPVVSNESCAAVYDSSVLIESEDICAGYAGGGHDSCQGDSGGPLLAPSMAGPLLVGITSGGTGCAREMLPGFYERVASHAAWISTHVPSVTIRSPTAVLVSLL